MRSQQRRRRDGLGFRIAARSSVGSSASVSGPTRADMTVAESGVRWPQTAPGDSTPLLSVDRLVKDFAVTVGAPESAVADISFAVPSGSTFGLVGQSGSGKTTIGRLIMGLEKPNSGRIWLGTEDLIQMTTRDRRSRARDVTLMFQNSYASMNPRKRVEIILREPLVVQRQGSRVEQRRRVAAVLDEVGLPASAADCYPHEFRLEQLQRVALARALILRPSLIVADEPVATLDASVQTQILNLMRNLQRRHELSYLLVSQDLSVLRYTADLIGVMYLGKLVETGPADEVCLNPVHPYTKGLVDTVPVAYPAAERAREHWGVIVEPSSALAPAAGCRFRTRCARAQELCTAIEPPLRPFAASGHLAACHFPLREPGPRLSSA